MIWTDSFPVIILFPDPARNNHILSQAVETNIGSVLRRCPLDFHECLSCPKEHRLFYLEDSWTTHLCLQKDKEVNIVEVRRKCEADQRYVMPVTGCVVTAKVTRGYHVCAYWNNCFVWCRWMHSKVISRIDFALSFALSSKCFAVFIQHTQSFIKVFAMSANISAKSPSGPQKIWLIRNWWDSDLDLEGMSASWITSIRFFQRLKKAISPKH